MKKKIKKIISTILLCTILAGCSNENSSHEIPLDNSSNCPISTMRTGIERQGIKSWGNGFECTQEGSYFMHITGKGSWLLYADHGSDTVIKLCGRPDCSHTDSDCNAYFNDASTICYYDGYLYTLEAKQLVSFADKNLIRMNLDGTERQVSYNTSEFIAANGYKSLDNIKIMNGMLFFMVGMIDENGILDHEGAYYKLDGSMEQPNVDVFLTPALFTDGESFVGNGLTCGSWDPEKGFAEEFPEIEVNGYGYYGRKAHYYVENGVIIEESYTEGKKELIDTGHTGDYQLACFPDCIVMYEKEHAHKEKIMYFYDWDYNSLGSVKIDYNFEENIVGFICGETPERIFLTDELFCLPHYYINKSDFGTGNIEIHPLNVPEDLVVSFEED